MIKNTFLVNTKFVSFYMSGLKYAEDLKHIFEDVTFNIQSNGDLNKSWCLMENTHLNKMKIIIYISELLNLSLLV